MQKFHLLDVLAWDTKFIRAFMSVHVCMCMCMRMVMHVRIRLLFKAPSRRGQAQIMFFSQYLFQNGLKFPDAPGIWAILGPPVPEWAGTQLPKGSPKN